MLRNLGSPAAGDEVELVDDGDSVDIRYRLRRHCSKCRLFVLALAILFLAGAISVVYVQHFTPRSGLGRLGAYGLGGLGA